MMNTLTKKIFLLMLIFLICILQTPAYAGPLDRTDEPRTNPVVNDMLRIPGVVGMNKFEAMSTLQQAGLNPAIKTKTAINPKYKGMECMIISQTPVPGGVAMIGSSVTIYVYMPPGASCDAQPGKNQWTNEQPPEGGEQWQNEGQVDEQQAFPDDQSDGFPDDSNQQMNNQQPEQRNDQFKQIQPVKPKIIWKPVK